LAAATALKIDPTARKAPLDFARDKLAVATKTYLHRQQFQFSGAIAEVV